MTIPVTASTSHAYDMVCIAHYSVWLSADEGQSLTATLEAASASSSVLHKQPGTSSLRRMIRRRREGSEESSLKVITGLDYNADMKRIEEDQLERARKIEAERRTRGAPSASSKLRSAASTRTGSGRSRGMVHQALERRTGPSVREGVGQEAQVSSARCSAVTRRPTVLYTQLSASRGAGPSKRRRTGSAAGSLPRASEVRGVVPSRSTAALDPEADDKDDFTVVSTHGLRPHPSSH